MKSFLSILGLIVLGLISSAWGQAVVGQAAPPFTLADTQGRVHSLEKDAGKYVVLEWFNYDCPFVKKHYGSGNMQKLQKEYTAKGVIWYSICSSAPGKQGYFQATEMEQKARERQVASTAVLLDSDGKVGKLYGAKTTPHLFVIDPQGKLIYEGAIDSIRSTDVADIAKATNYVSMALDEAMAGKPVSTPITPSYGCSVKY